MPTRKARTSPSFYDAVSTVSLLVGDPLVKISLDNGKRLCAQRFCELPAERKKRPDGGSRRARVRVYLTMTSPSGDQTVSDDFKINAGGTGLGHIFLPDNAEEGTWKVTGHFTCDDTSLNSLVNSLTFSVGKIKICLEAKETDVSGAPGKTVITYTSEEALPLRCAGPSRLAGHEEWGVRAGRGVYGHGRQPQPLCDAPADGRVHRHAQRSRPAKAPAVS